MTEITAAHMCCECGYISETGAVTASTGFHWCVCVCYHCTYDKYYIVNPRTHTRVL